MKRAVTLWRHTQRKPRCGVSSSLPFWLHLHTPNYNYTKSIITYQLVDLTIVQTVQQEVAWESVKCEVMFACFRNMCVSMEILQLVVCIPYKVSQRFCDVLKCHRAVVFGKLFERPRGGVRGMEGRRLLVL